MTAHTCPECGTPLPADASDALCPACLMSKALASAGDATQKLTGANTIAKGGALPSMFPFDFGGYRVLSLLGRGGMGAVYEAEQRDTGRRVALKVLGHDLDSEDMRKRFLREGRLAAAVTHPNSLYIFGTEEIEGTPVIVMEIAGGGTLKDELKRRGPLPVNEAVDAMLQIVAGLEAAHAGGVLHRDVKPANCFLAPDRTAKVGDFGLSVSTLARQDSQLTASGMMLGTPSFAPPEQLRGDELDVRADIYSVGATLYTLLTGRAPFEGENAVQVVAAVLDKAPKPIAELRKDVPKGLAEVITRCMAKKREARFADYSVLREALLPFSSLVPQPAPLGLRFLAGLLDDLIADLPWMVLAAVLSVEFEDRFLSQRSMESLLPWLGAWLGYLAYFVIAEGLWGAGIGKALCGLRVARPQGQAPGLVRALVRVLAFDVFAMSTLLPLLLTSGPEYAELVKTGAYFGKWWFWFNLASWFGLFITMRRSNGFAALQDLVSGTHVVVRAKAATRPKPEIPDDAADEPPANSERIGPFAVVKPLGAGWILGHDPALRRRVWIQRGAGALTEARRDVARPGRLRWLAGTAEWNACEAPGGQELLSFEPQSQPWAAVRFWLADLAEELVAAEKDGTLPAGLDMRNVWITREGRAVLLDKERRFSIADECERRLQTAAPCSGTQQFLAAVSAHALDPKTVPLHARDVLQKLAAAAFDRMSFAAGNLQSLLNRPAIISPLRRAASLVLLPVLVMLGLVLVQLSFQFESESKDAKWRKLHPDLPPLSAVLRLREASDTSEGTFFAWRPDMEMDRVTRTHIVAHYLPPDAQADMNAMLNRESPFADQSLPMTDDDRGELATLFHEYWKLRSKPNAPLTPEEITTADARLREEMPKFLTEERRRLWLIATNGLRNILAVIAITQFFSLLISGATLGQKVFGFTVLNKKGERAGRLRMLGRWFIAWVPFILLFARLEVAAFTHKDLGTADIVKCSAFGFVWVLGVIAAIIRPPQGLHDEQAKTWLVPR